MANNNQSSQNKTPPVVQTQETVLKDNENVAGIVKPVDIEALETETKPNDAAVDDVKAADPIVDPIVPPVADAAPPVVQEVKALGEVDPLGPRTVRIDKVAFLGGRLYDPGIIHNWVGPLAGNFMHEV